MWFGTWDGLNKYDGYSYVIYRPDILNPLTSLSNKSIQALCEDHNAYIWVGTERGLNRFDRRSGTFKQYFREDGNEASIGCDTIQCIAEDDSGILWIGTIHGLNAYNPSSDKFERLPYASESVNSLSDNDIRGLIKDGNKLWIASNTGIDLMDLKSRLINHIILDKESPFELRPSINSIFKCSNGSILVGSNHGIFLISSGTHTIEHFDLKNISASHLNSNDVTCVFEDKSSILWVGTRGGGLCTFDRSTRKYERYSNEADDNQSLSNDFISVLYEDRSGIIWVGTSWNGVNEIVKNKYYFKHVYPVSNDNKSLNSNLVWAFMQDGNDKIWIGTEKGINILNRKTNTFTYMHSSPGAKNSLAGSKIRTIFRDSHNDIWVATESEGVSRLKNGNPSQIKNYTHNPTDPQSIPNDAITNITEDSAGKIWMATRGSGICSLDPNTGKFTVISNRPGVNNSLSSNTVWSVFFDSHGRLWAGTSNGLSLYIPSTGQFRVFRHKPENLASLSNNDVFTVAEDPKGIIWIGTIGGGLNRFDPATETFRIYTEKDGLANNVIYNILIDEAGWLWMSTNYGISRFDPYNEAFYNYDVRDGIQSNEFNYGAALKLSTGEMMFGGMNGYNIFKPSEIRKNNYAPPVVVTSFKIFDKLIEKEFKSGDTIQLNYTQNFFSIGFAALDYTNPQKNRHKYILENVDKRWEQAEVNRHLANYTDVKPGTYTFRLIGSNNDGVWCEKEFLLTIIIQPPWYVTNKFRGSLLLFIIALTWFLIWRRIVKLKRKHAVEKKLLTLENQIMDVEKKALRLQMNPHFIFNAMNSIQSFILSNETEKAIHYLTRFSHLMRLILTNSRESWVSLENELKALEYYVEIERLRFDERFDFQLQLDPGMNIEKLEIPPMLIQPFVENAIIHGLLHKKEKGRIIIRILYTKGVIHCEVEDNGVGREKSRQIKENSGLKRPSMGMFITGRRVDLLKASSSEKFGINVIDMLDNEGNASGTKVEIDIVPMVKHT